jgi:hypothetical protein
MSINIKVFIGDNDSSMKLIGAYPKAAVDSAFKELSGISWHSCKKHEFLANIKATLDVGARTFKIYTYRKCDQLSKCACGSQFYNCPGKCKIPEIQNAIKILNSWIMPTPVKYHPELSHMSAVIKRFGK